MNFDLSEYITWNRAIFAITFLLINVISYVIIKDAGQSCKGCTDSDCEHCTNNSI